ncbi:MAG: GNAT family N-acetyltransferase [Solobacterium sp.]|nr:GNAT family N-acetyltransferase [Solobacterium sp.]
MIHLVRVTKENLDYAVFIQNTLFPSFNGQANFEDSVSGKADNEYDLVYDQDVCVGITGIYTYDTDPDSAWLGWFGILEPYRRRHYGKETIRLFEEAAKARGFHHTRIYTDRYDNETAIAFYTSCGYTSEIYDNPYDPACYEYPMLIFSKSLNGSPVIPWNNRSIHLTEQMEKELMPQKKYHFDL